MQNSPQIIELCKEVATKFLVVRCNQQSKFNELCLIVMPIAVMHKVNQIPRYLKHF